MAQVLGSVRDLIGTFHDCLEVLAPLLLKVGIEWEDEKQYDDWDEIAEALYSSVVASSVAYAVEGQPFEKLGRYGFRLPTYSARSYLYSRDLGSSAAFLCLQTGAVRFDRAAFSILDSNAVPTGRVETAPLHDLHFVARVRSPQGERDIERVVLRECGDHL